MSPCKGTKAIDNGLLRKNIANEIRLSESGEYIMELKGPLKKVGSIGPKKKQRDNILRKIHYYFDLEYKKDGAGGGLMGISYGPVKLNGTGEEYCVNYWLKKQQEEYKRVVHAHWVDFGFGQWICSECQYTAPIVTDGEDDYPSFLKYCSTCGAKMHEGVEK